MYIHLLFFWFPVSTVLWKITHRKQSIPFSSISCIALHCHIIIAATYISALYKLLCMLILLQGYTAALQIIPNYFAVISRECTFVVDLEYVKSHTYNMSNQLYIELVVPVPCDNEWWKKIHLCIYRDLSMRKMCKPLVLPVGVMIGRGLDHYINRRNMHGMHGMMKTLTEKKQVHYSMYIHACHTIMVQIERNMLFTWK